MEYLEIINEYNRNIRSKDMSHDETWRIFKERIVEYKKANPYATDFGFLYPYVLGWDENWIESMRSGYKNIKQPIKDLVEKIGKLKLNSIEGKYQKLQEQYNALLSHAKNMSKNFDIAKKHYESNDCDFNYTALDNSVDEFKEFCKENQIEY